MNNTITLTYFNEVYFTLALEGNEAIHIRCYMYMYCQNKMLVFLCKLQIA